MRPKLYDTDARRVSVSLELNGDLYAKIQAAELDASAIAELALAGALRERVRGELRQEMVAYNDYVRRHGSFADMVREDEAAKAEHEAV